MDEKIIDQVLDNKEEMLSSIIDLVNMPSVKKDMEPGCPYGRDLAEILNKTLKIAENMGFDTVNLDNYLGYAQFGQGDDYICIIGHLDVVEPAGQWTSPPFQATLRQGRIYGRGVLDNKGPLISCLYGLYAIKQLGIELKRPVRIIFGCDEESGFGDLEHYLKKEKPPVMGWTPDCKYPVVYGERGRMSVRFIASDGNHQALVDFVNNYIFNQNPDGTALGIRHLDQEFGTTLMRNFKLGLNNQDLTFAMDISYPAGITWTKIMAIIREKADSLEVEMVKNYDPVKFDKDAPMVKMMQRAYEKITGCDGTPVTTTGGTYAKLMPNIVPFGPSFPGQKGIAHLPDEWMDIDDIVENAKIYALAIYYLGGLENGL